MKYKNRDYSKLTAIAAHCGMIPFQDRFGKMAEGVYTLKGFHAPVDLSACAEDEKSILRTAVKQLAERADEAYNNAIEKDLSS